MQMMFSREKNLNIKIQDCFTHLYVFAKISMKLELIESLMGTSRHNEWNSIMY